MGRGGAASLLCYLSALITLRGVLLFGDSGGVVGGSGGVVGDGGGSVQFSPRWYLCARKTPHVLPQV